MTDYITKNAPTNRPIYSVVYYMTVGRSLLSSPEAQGGVTRIRSKKNLSYERLLKMSESELIDYGSRVTYNSPEFQKTALPAFVDIRPFIEDPKNSLAELVVRDVERDVLIQVDHFLKPKRKSKHYEQKHDDWKAAEAGCAANMPLLVRQFCGVLAAVLKDYRSRLTDMHRVVTRDISFQVEEAFDKFYYELFPGSIWTRSVR